MAYPKSRLAEFKASMGPAIKELKFTISRIKKSPLSIIGIAIILFFVVVAAMAPILAPPVYHDPYLIPRDGYGSIPKPPSEKHIFGTTEGQYDIFYGVVWGTRSAFRIGFMVVLSIALIGLVIGSISGYYGGIVDEIMMRFTDIIFAFPTLILAMALVIALPYSIEIPLGITTLTFSLQQLDKVLLALILVGWPSYARLIRGEILRVKQESFVEAAKAIGCSDFRVIVKHILPNSIYPLLIMASLDVGSIVLTAAGLSFLGLGAPMGYADWGQMISFSRNWIIGPMNDPYRYWFTFTIPGVFIFTFVLGWNLLGDAFRDILDPTLRRR